MNGLLEEALEAHGGLKRWQSVQRVRARVRSGGFAPRSHFVAKPIADYHLTVFMADLGKPREPAGGRDLAVLHPFPRPGRRGVFGSEAVRIESEDGETLEERRDPRSAFSGLSGLSRNVRWDHLDILYFGGYAMWNYVNLPFLLAGEGFQLREGEPWEEEGERWRRLHASFPAGIQTHSREQTFYFDQRGLLRRQDYTAEPFGNWAKAAHYCYDHTEADGFVFPSRRRVYPRRRNNRPRARPTVVWIDLEEIEVS